MDGEQGQVVVGPGRDFSQGETTEQRLAREFQARAEAYQREMEFLERGGSDSGGMEQWKRLMRGLGRR